MTPHSVLAHPIRQTLVATVAVNAATVGTLYLVQTLVAPATQEFGLAGAIRMMPGLALAGYAMGVAFSATWVRDLTSRTGLAGHVVLLATALWLAAWAPTPGLLAAACLLIGVGCSSTQRLLAIASSAAAPDARARAIGWIIAGGLCGIVLTRAVLPFAASSMGRRGLLSADACLIAMLGAGALWTLEPMAATRPSAPASLPSAGSLWRRQPSLRHAALQQALVFAVYNFGWAIYPHGLHGDGVTPAIRMGVIALLGACAAMLAGWACGRIDPADLARSGLCAVGVGALLAAVGQSAHSRDAAMALVDIGTQIALVANQARAQASASSSPMRGRLAAIVTTVGFLGGAFGAALGNASH